MKGNEDKNRALLEQGVFETRLVYVLLPYLHTYRIFSATRKLSLSVLLLTPGRFLLTE